MVLGLEISQVEEKINEVERQAAAAANLKGESARRVRTPRGEKQDRQRRAKPTTKASRRTLARPNESAPTPGEARAPTEWRFANDQNGIEMEIEELTAKAVVLQESMDIMESDWKGKPMDKATLDVVTTLGIERSEIMQRLDVLSRQLKQIEVGVVFDEAPLSRAC